MHEDHRWVGARIEQRPFGGEGPDQPERGPYFLLWIVYLFFRPRTFFRHFVDDQWPSLLVACAWIFGMARGADRLITRGSMQGTQNNPIFNSWGAFWTTVLIGGAISGLLYYLLGGWWYRVRLRWSGDPDPDKTLARRVYLYAAQVLAIPAMIVLASTAPMYATPAEMIDAPFKWADLLPMAFVPWSIIVSFIGVRTVFDTGLVRSLIWFLILPMVLIFGAVVAVIAAAFLLAPLEPPDLKPPAIHRSALLSFDHPSNWPIDTADPDYDADYYIPMEMPQDAFFVVQVYASDAGATEVLEQTIGVYRSVLKGMTKRSDLTTWHGMNGVGQQHTGTVEGKKLLLTVFERSADDGLGVEIIALHLAEDEDLLRPGFELIAGSLNFSP